MGLTVVDILQNKVDFKFKFVDKYNFEISVSNGIVSVPRKQNGILVDFGLDNEFDCQFMNESKKLSFKNMNDIKLMFKKVYTEQVSYLLIDETVVNWSSRHKLLPIKLQQPDFIVYKWSSNKINNKYNTRAVDYYETTFLCQTYNNNFSIWESLIRKGLLNSDVDINDNQLDRICNPAL